MVQAVERSTTEASKENFGFDKERIKTSPSSEQVPLGEVSAQHTALSQRLKFRQFGILDSEFGLN